MHRTRSLLLTAVACASFVACDNDDASRRSATDEPPASVATTTAVAPAEPDDVVIEYRLDRRTDDALTAEFTLVVTTTLDDPRGWVRAGFRFVQSPDAPFSIVLAEGSEVDALCLPYDTFGQFSCQNGPVVALNADRWRGAHPKWTGDLPTYRQMLVNHEVGHLIGMHHPDVQCPSPGQPAPIMAQQSTELDGCLPNPWPLPHEIERAARHDLKIAPGYGE